MTRVRPSPSSGSGRPIAGWLALALALVAACGERADGTPLAPGTAVPGGQPGTVEAGQPDVVAGSPSDTVVAGGQSGTEGEGGRDYDSTDIVGDGEVARSFVQIGRLGPANLVRPFRHLYREGRDGANEEALGNGVISGQVEPVCVHLAIVPEAPELDGVPYPQHVQDETWSSPFCAPYRSAALK